MQQYCSKISASLDLQYSIMHLHIRARAITSNIFVGSAVSIVTTTDKHFPKDVGAADSQQTETVRSAKTASQCHTSNHTVQGEAPSPSIMIRRSGLQKGLLEYSATWTCPSGLMRNMAGSGKGCSVSLMLRGWLTYRPHLCMSVSLRP